jgi:hypothetical protein
MLKRFVKRRGWSTPVPLKGQVHISSSTFTAIVPVSLFLNQFTWGPLSLRRPTFRCRVRICSWLETAEHRPFSHILIQVSPLYVCTTKAVCFVPFLIRLLFLPHFVSPLYRHYHPSRLRYQDCFFYLGSEYSSRHPIFRHSWYDIWYDMIRYDMIWYDMIWYDMIWYDMIWYDMIWYDMIYIYLLQLRFHPVTAVGKLVQK